MENDFSGQLSRYLGHLKDLRGRGASEASIRDAILRFLREAFPDLERTEPILLEKHIPALEVRGGFADVLYGDLIIECKRRLDDHSRAEGREELARYLRNQQHPERFVGILTDGENLEVVALREEELVQVDQLTLAVQSAEHVKLWLECYLFHEKNLVPTAEDVALRFGERSPAFWHSFRTLQALWREVEADATAQTKFVEWQSLLSIVYGSEVGDIDLFLRHTYLAMFARSLAFVALQRCSPTPEELLGMVTGEVFERIGFENFVGDDFFTWITVGPISVQAQGLLGVLATRLTVAYDLSAIHEDLLKELYQELVDPQTRHDLGEFYTPDWLAEWTLRQAGFPPPKGSESSDPSLLDPSCGSGTFLFTAVRLLREAGWHGSELINFCSSHLAGLDVHPLAVTIAKTNLLLALGSDLTAYGQRFALPIYMADSLSSVEDGNTHPEIEVQVPVEELARRAGKAKPCGVPSSFGLPAVLADQADLLRAALDALWVYADPNLDPTVAGEGFRERLRELGLPDGQHHQWEANLDLMRWLLTPPATDSVWRFILKNGYQPELLSRRKFAYVVGNPPWLSYRYIQRRDYQERVRKLTFQYGLLEKKKAHLFTQMDLATLFFAFCAHRYLAQQGVLAFVMPRSILTGAKQHTEFRNRYVATAQLLIDCEQVTPLFNVPACVVIWTQRRKRKVPLLRLQGQLPVRNADSGTAKKHLKQMQESYMVPAAETTSPYWGEVVNGATIFPRCLWFVRPPKIAIVIDRKQPQLETDITTKRQAKPPWKGQRVLGSVEADFLFATLLSDHMVPFGWRQLLMVVLPVIQNQEGRLDMIHADQALRMGKIGLAQWLRSAEELWQRYAKVSQRVETIYDRLDFSRCLTRQKPSGCYKVLYNSQGTHICSCVVDTSAITAENFYSLQVRGFIAENVTYWFETVNQGEANYLCAVLNAPFVDQTIKPYQTKGQFGAQRGGGERHIHRRPFEVLPIPKFDKSNQRHRKLAELSQCCHDKVRQFVAESEEKLLSAPIGRLRTQIRRELIKDELAEINSLVSAMLR